MTLLVMLGLLAIVFVLVLWFLGMVVQGWIYQAPADYMVVRSLVGGSLIAVFLTGWCWLDQERPGTYDTLLEFSSSEIQEYSSFDSVRRMADGTIQIVTYRKRPLGRGASSDYLNDRNEPWSRNPSQSMMIAILIQEPHRKEPTRFNANLVKVMRQGKEVEEFPRDELRYIEEGGERYMSEGSLGRVVNRRWDVFYANMALNIGHLVLWVVVLWLGLSFSLGHATVLALALWLLVMLGVQPLLFSQFRVPGH